MISYYNIKQFMKNKLKENEYLRHIIMLLVSFFIVTSSINFTYADKLDEVVLQLRWHHQFQFAGYYVAKWMGYYEDEGIDVEIRPSFTDAGNVLMVTKEVGEGRAHFGIGAADILLSENEGYDFSVVASLFQRSAVEFYMRDDTYYNSLVDFTNLDVARRKNDLLDIELQAMYISEGINPEKYNLLNENKEFTIEDLTLDRYDIIPSYLGTISFYGQKDNMELKVVRPIDYGIDFYGDSLFTNREFAYENPDIVEGFRRASMKGWEYALENPIEVAERISKEYEVEGKTQHELFDYNDFQAKKVRELTLYPVVQIGNINPYRWEKMEDILYNLNLIDSKIDIDDFIFDYEKIKSEKLNELLGIIFISLILVSISSIGLLLFNLMKKNIKLRDEILERKRIEKNILRSNQRYETIFDSALLGITVTTIEGIILQVNEKWLEMTGYSDEEVIGKNILDFITEDYKESQLEIVEKFKDRRIHKFEIERKYVKKDGSIFWGKLYITTTYDTNSEEIVNIGMVVDITLRKLEEEAVRRSEKRFRNIINDVATEISEKEKLAITTKEDSYFQQEEDTIDDKNRLALKLEKINLELEKMFKKELEENRNKEALIIYQARLAAMGEMIANIAHQWRQPLNSLGLILSNIKDAYIFDELDEESLDDSIDRAKKLTMKMSDTIDDFRYFLNPKTKKQCFSIYENISSVIDLVEENLRFNNIEVRIAKEISLKGYGYPNQYSQAIFNIINNSIDALESKDIENKYIEIFIYEENNQVVAQFKDNGGGVSEEIGDKVFDIYFTTKEQSGGTGLGLYMTKTIIENNMNGTISWENYNEGLIMKVSIPKHDGGE